MDKTASGWMNGFLGMLIFSGSLPATRVAVAAFDPVFLTVARAGIAGLLGLALLLVFRQKRPERGDLISLAVVACGVVIGFPVADRACAQAHHRRSFGCLRCIAAAVDRDLRRAARRRTPAPGVLAVFRVRRRARRRFCAGSGDGRVTCRRSADVRAPSSSAGWVMPKAAGSRASSAAGR